MGSGEWENEVVRSVAWVPDDDPKRDWNVAAELAVDWVEERCKLEGASGILVTNALGDLGVPALEGFERRHSRVSRRSRRLGHGSSPVLSYVPTYDDLEFAAGLAHGSSLAVVESVAYPLYGWAAWFGALNLVTGEPAPDLEKGVREAANRLRSYGKSAFADPFDKQRAWSIVNDLRAGGHLDRDLLLGAALAAGVPARGIKNLARLI